MALSPEFAQKLEDAGNNQRNLVSLLNAIDEEKRSLKSALSQLSSEPDGPYARGRERQVKIRRMKDKMSFLTEEREIVRQKLGRIKMDKKAVNRAASRRTVEFAHAFMAAAERVLPGEMFNELETRAAEILQSE